MNRLKTILVDDLSEALSAIERIIDLYDLPLDIVGRHLGAESALKALADPGLEADLLIVDIEMPDGSGLNLGRFARAKHPGLALLFCTGHKNYAIDAIRLGAQDYLLKPVNPEELRLAAERIITARSAEQKPHRGHGAYVVLSDQTHHFVVSKADILLIRGIGSYAEVVMADGSKITLSRNLKFIEQQLPDFQFFRCHKSCIINLHGIRHVVRGQELEVELTNGEKVPIAQRRRSEFLSEINQL